MANELFNDECKDCIEEMSTGRRFDTEMIPVEGNELKALKKQAGWRFKWHFHHLLYPFIWLPNFMKCLSAIHPLPFGVQTNR